MINMEKQQSNASGSGATPKTLAEFLKKDSMEGINATARFSPDENKVFDELGKQAHAKNPNLDSESIKQNFVNALKKGKTAREAFDYLEKQNCQTAKIAKGLICFFADEAGTKEISLEDFLEPRIAKIGGNETLTEKYLIMRQRIIGDTTQAWASLQESFKSV